MRNTVNHAARLLFAGEEKTTTSRKVKDTDSSLPERSSTQAFPKTKLITWHTDARSEVQGLVERGLDGARANRRPKWRVV
jgi:hypothetical protein